MMNRMRTSEIPADSVMTRLFDDGSARSANSSSVPLTKSFKKVDGVEERQLAENARGLHNARPSQPKDLLHSPKSEKVDTLKSSLVRQSSRAAGSHSVPTSPMKSETGKTSWQGDPDKEHPPSERPPSARKTVT